MNVNSRSPVLSFSRRNSEVHPHHCQACMSLLLAVRSGGRGSLGHVPTMSSSPVHSNLTSVSTLKPSLPPDLSYSDSSSPIHMTPASLYTQGLQNTSLSLSKSSIPVQITPPSPVHKGHSPAPAQNTASPLSRKTTHSPLHISIPSPVHTSPVDHPSSLRSSSPVSPIGPHSPCLGDSSDLSHLNRCLHHIISCRTSSPVLMDKPQPGDNRIDASADTFFVPQVHSPSSLHVPVSHQDTGCFSVQDSEARQSLVVGNK